MDEYMLRIACKANRYLQLEKAGLGQDLFLVISGFLSVFLGMKAGAELQNESLTFQDSQN